VVELLWTGGYIYQKNTGGDFYVWLGTNWAKALDPSLGGVSADSTAIPKAAYIIDQLNNTWTLNGSYIYKKYFVNDSTIQNPYAYNVQLLLWYGGLIYHQGTGGQFYVLPPNTDGPWKSCSDPRINKTVNTGSFYGVNGHWDYYGYMAPDGSFPLSPSTVASTEKSLGCSIYRIGC
jgi:hypothetical protein